jgi:hypothetical protein
VRRRSSRPRPLGTKCSIPKVESCIASTRSRKHVRR